MSTDLGSAYFQLIPSLRGAQGTIEKELNTAGASSGAKFSKGFNKSLVGTAALGAGIAVAAVGISKFTGFIGDSIKAVGNWQALNAQSASAVKATGAAAGVSAKQVNALAQSLEGQTATQAESIQQGANLLLTFKGIRNAAGKGNDIFNQTTAAAVDMARAMGTDVPSAALTLGKALNDPAQGLTKLTKQGVTFTDGQKAQIKALQATGDTMGAQKIILKELNSEFGGSGAAYAKTYEGSMYRLSDAVGDFGEKIATAALPGITKLIDTGSDIAAWATNSGAVSAFGDAISAVFGGLSDKIAGVDFNSVTGKFQSAFAGIQAYAAKVLPPLEAAFAKLGPALGDWFGTVGPILAQTVASLAPALASVIPLLAQAAGDILPSLAQLLQALVPILPPLAQAIAAIAPALAFIVTNGVVPLVAASAGLVSFFGQLANGANVSQLLLDGLKGKFGPLVQILGTFGAAVGTYIGQAILKFRNFASGVQGVLTAVGTYIGTSINRLRTFAAGVIGALNSAAAGTVSFSTRAVAAFARFAAGVAAKIGEAIRFVGSIPGRAASAIGNVASILFSSGQALVRGFISGIASMIGAVGSAASSVMQRVRDFFPHSPAKRGPFSGSGWRAVATSGGALAAQFTGGFNSGVKDFASTIGGIVPDTISSSVAGTITDTSQGSGNKPIYTDHGVLFGMIQQGADGVARLVLNQQNAAEDRVSRLGYQPVVLGA